MAPIYFERTPGHDGVYGPIIIDPADIMSITMHPIAGAVHIMKNHRPEVYTLHFSERWEASVFMQKVKEAMKAYAVGGVVVPVAREVEKT